MTHHPDIAHAHTGRPQHVDAEDRMDEPDEIQMHHTAYSHTDSYKCQRNHGEPPEQTDQSRDSEQKHLLPVEHDTLQTYELAYRVKLNH